MVDLGCHNQETGESALPAMRPYKVAAMVVEPAAMIPPDVLSHTLSSPPK
jgi:hypothetical protein